MEIVRDARGREGGGPGNGCQFLFGDMEREGVRDDELGERGKVTWEGVLATGSHFYLYFFFRSRKGEK